MGGPGSGRRKGSKNSMSRKDPSLAKKITTNKLQDKSYAKQKKNYGPTKAGRGYKLPKGYKQRPQ